MTLPTSVEDGVSPSLIERLQAAKAGSRELDRAILKWNRPNLTPLRERYHDGRDWAVIPAYTTSLDAAVALVERVRPGHEWTVEKCGDLYFSTINTHPGVTYGSKSVEARAFTAPLAMCRALMLPPPASDNSREGLNPSIRPPKGGE